VNLNSQIADMLVAAQIRALRLGATLGQEVRSILERMGEALVALLRRFDPSQGNRIATRMRHVTSLNEAAVPVLRATYRELLRHVDSRIVGVAVNDIERVTERVNTVAGLPLLRPVRSEEVVAARITAIPFPVGEGAPAGQAQVLPTWWKRQMVRMGERIAATLATGVHLEEDLPHLVARLRGTKARAFRDGVIAIGQREAETLALTALSLGVHQGRGQLWNDNTDVIRGIVHVSTLDARTSFQCIGRSGLVYRLPNHEPVGHSVPYLTGVPYHWKCRSTFNPVFRPYAELLGARGVQFDSALAALPEGTRDSLDGQVPASTTFQQWLDRQPERIQTRLLGKQRLALWKAGKITLPQVIDQVTGRPLRVKELVS
jgi:hypothetical protein